MDAESGDTLRAKHGKEPAAGKSTHNARYDIQKETFAGPVDDLAGDETRDQAEHNPSGD